MIEIKNRYTGKVIHSGEFESIKDLLLDAISSNADLWDADLRNADLRTANLCNADLCGANLCNANLCNADLRTANLCNADLRNADLRTANLCNADLCGANLCNANLCNADLCGANLCNANLCNADLRGCAGNRSQIKSLFISDVYSITYTSEFLQIGCERHSISKWLEFDNKRIAEMYGKKELKFWSENKAFIKSAIELYPATETKREGSAA